MHEQKASFLLTILYFPRCIAVFLVFCLFAGPLAADVIFLRNQKYLKGSVTGQSTDSIQVKLADGSIKNIKKSAIKKIIYVPAARQTELDEEAKRMREERERRAREERQRREIAEKKRKEALRKKQEAERRRREEKRRNVERKRRRASRLFGATWRNAVFPGWGHVYGGRDKLGKQLMGASGFALFFWYFFDRDYNSAQQDYDRATQVGLVGAAGSEALAVGAALRADQAREDIRVQGQRAYYFQILFGIVLWYGLYDIRNRGIAGFSLNVSPPSNPLAKRGRLKNTTETPDISFSFSRRF